MDEAQEVSVKPNTHWVVLGLLAIAAFLVTLERNFLSLNFSAIQRDLGESISSFAGITSLSMFRASLIGLGITLLADRYGKRAFLGTALALLAFAALGKSMSVSMFGLGGFTMLTGFASAVAIAVALGAAANVLEHRWRAFAIIGVYLCTHIATIVGPFLLSAGDTTTWRASERILALGMILCALGLWVLDYLGRSKQRNLAEGNVEDAPAHTGQYVSKGVLKGVAGSFVPLAVASFGLFLATLAVAATNSSLFMLLNERGLESSSYSSVYAYRNFATIIGLIAMAFFAQKRFAPILIAILCILNGLLHIWLGNAQSGNTGITILSILMGLVSGGITGLLIAELPSLVPPQSWATGNYILLTGAAIAWSLGAAISAPFFALFRESMYIGYNIVGGLALFAAPFCWLALSQFRRF